MTKAKRITTEAKRFREEPCSRKFAIMSIHSFHYATPHDDMGDASARCRLHITITLLYFTIFVMNTLPNAAQSASAFSCYIPRYFMMKAHANAHVTLFLPLFHLITMHEA